MSQDYFLEFTGVGKNSGETVAWLSDLGYVVCIISEQPYYLAWEVVNEYLAWMSSLEI